MKIANHLSLNQKDTTDFWMFSEYRHFVKFSYQLKQVFHWFLQRLWLDLSSLTAKMIIWNHAPN